MNIRIIVGGVLAYFYNNWIGSFPSRRIRRLFLKRWLGQLGKGTSIQMDCRFLNGRKVHLGARNIINFGCLMDGRKYSIITGDDVSIGPEASILTLGHDPKSRDFVDRGADVTIGNHVWIGYRATILPGVTIGDGAVVGAGSVVTQNVAAYTIVAGVPAREIGKRSPELNYQLNYSPWLV